MYLGWILLLTWTGQKLNPCHCSGCGVHFLCDSGMPGAEPIPENDPRSDSDRCTAVLYEDGFLLCENHHADQSSWDRTGFQRSGEGADDQHDFCRLYGAEKEITYRLQELPKRYGNDPEIFRVIFSFFESYLDGYSVLVAARARAAPAKPPKSLATISAVTSCGSVLTAKPR